MMMVGCNPVVSMFAGIKFPAYNPGSGMSDAKKRGLKLIVIDPRKSEVAKRADLHLQVKPGEDPTLLAGIMHVIFEEGLYDGDFCSAYVEGSRSCVTVKDFTPEYVESARACPRSTSWKRRACSRTASAASPPPEPALPWRRGSNLSDSS